MPVLRFEPVPRLGLRLDRRVAAPTVVLLAWGALLLIATLLMSRGPDSPQTLCVFRNATGVPCPTCGATRMVHAIAAGRPLAAVTLNPLLALTAALVGVWTAARLGFGRRVRLELSARGWRSLTVVVMTLVAVNWVYVIARH